MAKMKMPFTMDKGEKEPDTKGGKKAEAREEKAEKAAGVGIKAHQGPSHRGKAGR